MIREHRCSHGESKPEGNGHDHHHDGDVGDVCDVGDVGDVGYVGDGNVLDIHLVHHYSFSQLPSPPVTMRNNEECKYNF